MSHRTLDIGRTRTGTKLHQIGDKLEAFRSDGQMKGPAIMLRRAGSQYALIHARLSKMVCDACIEALDLEQSVNCTFVALH